MFYKARRILLLFIFFVFIPVVLSAQRVPGSNPTPDGLNVVGPPGGTAPFDISGPGILQLNSMMGGRQTGGHDSPLLNPELSVSKLDLQAPRKARQEFEKGLHLLYRKNYQEAMQHLSEATAIYPAFVSAHEALGTSLLSTGQNQEARDEFAKAAVLDSHLPASYLNLGYAELALKHYSSARLAAEKAAAIAPLDLSVLSLLAYAQLMSKDYAASVATADRVHANNDRNHAIVHLYAAAAWDGQGRDEEESRELETLVREDPTSRAAEQARGVLQRIQQDKEDREKRPSAATPVATAPAPTNQPTSEMKTQVQISRQNAREEQQIMEAEAICDSCEQTGVMHKLDATTGLRQKRENGWTLHSDVDEVAVFFVATDHGKPVSDLAKSEVIVRDAGKPPTSVVAFRSEDQLPLRLGLVIDESESVTSRFSFEQAAAADFVRKSVTGKNDLAFIVGVSNSVLLVQDFTADTAQISEAINSLAPAGGTALWDAVEFASDKLAKGTETQPVAKVLVVISDGQDNSSRTTLKQAIEAAERADVTVYTVSTNDVRYVATAFLDATILGDRALKNLAERTGGNGFVPGSIGNLDHSLAELQEFIHNRYSLSYKPAVLKGDGRYRTIHISAEKAGHKLRVYSRKGYYARANLPQNSTP